jgi:hypothetical protein
MMIGTALRARTWRQTSKPVEGFAPVERGDHLVALFAKWIGEQLLDRVLVVNEQDAGC